MVVKDFKLRKCISKLRLSSHDLNIEKGRFERKKVEDRLCNYCNLKTIEDESHVLLVCPSYSNERIKFIEEVRKHVPDYKMDFNSIMGSRNPNVLFCLGKYIQKIFNARKLCIL